MHERADDGGGLVVVHAFYGVRALGARVRKLHLAHLLHADRVVVVDDRNGVLRGAAQQERADVAAALCVVEVRVLHEQLPHGILRPDIPAVFGHQDGLSLRGIIRLDLLHVAQQLAAGPAQVVQPADLHRAARHPDHAGPQLAAEPCKDVVVDVVVGLADQRHGADLADEFIVKPHGMPLLQDCTRYALMNASRSPSMTAWMLPFSTPVRWSLTSVYGWNT